MPCTTPSSRPNTPACNSSGPSRTCLHVTAPSWLRKAARCQWPLSCAPGWHDQAVNNQGCLCALDRPFVPAKLQCVDWGWPLHRWSCREGEDSSTLRVARLQIRVFVDQFQLNCHVTFLCRFQQRHPTLIALFYKRAHGQMLLYLFKIPSRHKLPK